MLAETDSIDALRRKSAPCRRWRAFLRGENLFDVAGHTTLAGAELLSDRPPAASDSWAVRQLHSAGALLSGMLNMDAYAYGFTTENSHYGATRNPHDLSRIANGSSGGSAAAVAGRAGPFQPRQRHPNGSIRVPASLCGIFGLKPTFGRLSAPAAIRLSPVWIILVPLPAGWLDLAAVADALQGRDPADDFQADKPASAPATCWSADWGCAARGWGLFHHWCDDDARAAVDRVAHALRRRQRAAVRGCRPGPLGGLYHQRQRRRQSVSGGSSPLARAL